MKRTSRDFFQKWSALLALILVGCGGEDSTETTLSGGGIASENTSSEVEGIECDGDVCTVTGELTTDITFTNDKTWRLVGGVFIGDDVEETVLTIEPGTKIVAKSQEGGAATFLCIRRGSKIMADGTREEPIVFTSQASVGERSPQDWGGIIINGRAPINVGAEAEGEGGTGKYGGTDPEDSSGTLRYVRVEFAGFPVTPENELNSIAFQGVGSGTTVEYVQTHMGSDDGFEFFGGTVNAKYLVATGIDDDSFDWTDGWTGNAQFLIAQQYAGRGDPGIEADNNGDANDAAPMSNPTLANVTLVGSPDSDKSDIGMLLREGTAASIHNAVVTGFNDACLNIDHDVTFGNVADGNLVITNSLLSCATNFKKDSEYDTVEMGETCADGSEPVEKEKDGELQYRCYKTDAVDIETFFTDGEGNTTAEDWNAVLGAAYDEEGPDFTLATGSPAAEVTSATVPADGFFEQVDFIGAVGAEDWTTGWTTSDKN